MSAILTRPITAAPFFASPTICVQELATSFPKRLNLWGEFSCRKSVSWDIRRRGVSKMEGLKWVRASTTDDGVPAFEQEAFVDASPILDEGGIEATLNNLSKWLVAVTFVGVVIWRHDAESLWAALGSVLNAMLSVFLKNILNQERPVSTLRPDPGMPSSHAQCISYTVAFLVTSLVERMGLNALTITQSGLSIILGSYCAWLRVSQRLHTVSQVVVGAIVGTVFWFLWLSSWNTFVFNLFDSFLLARVLVTVAAIAFNVYFVYYSYQD